MLNIHSAMHGAFSAGRAVGEMQERIVQRFDKDGSGGLSLEEASQNNRLDRKFARIDTNSDGNLTSAEIGNHLSNRMARIADRAGGFAMGFGGMSANTAMMRMENYLSDDVGRAEASAVDTFNQLDTDGNGMLSDAELQAEIAAQEAAAAEEAARQEKIATVNRIDSDGDGILSMDELKAELQAREEARAEAEFNRLDSDGDGVLSDAELEAGIAAQTPTGTVAADAAETVPASNAGAVAGQSAVAAATASEEPAPMAADPAEAEASAPAPATPAPPIQAPAAPLDQANSDAPETRVMSMIENVFHTMMEEEGVSGDISGMSEALYTEAQELLLQQMENAVDFAAKAYGNADETATQTSNFS